MATKQVLVTTCDVCGAVKGEGNHWFSYEAPDESLFHVWREVEIECKAACGLTCLAKALALWAQGLSGK